MWTHRDEYTGRDKNGRLFNKEFPPVMTSYGWGYNNDNADVLFLDFAVFYYDLRITVDGKEYLCVVDDTDGAYLVDEAFNPITEYYPTANDFIKYCRYWNGRNLLDLINENPDIFLDIQ